MTIEQLVGMLKGRIEYRPPAYFTFDEWYEGTDVIIGMDNDMVYDAGYINGWTAAYQHLVELIEERVFEEIP